MSILSSTNAGKSVYLNQIKNWFLEDVKGSRIPETKSEDVEVSLNNGIIELFDKRSYDNSIVIKSLPELRFTFNIELQHICAGHQKAYDIVILQNLKADALNLNFTNNYVKIRNSKLGTISNWKANAVIFENGINFEMHSIANGWTMFCPNEVDKIENCEFKHLLMGYRAHYYAENEKGGNLCSVLLDNIKNCAIDTVVFTPDNIKQDLKELNDEAQEILNRFFASNKVRLAVLQLKNTSTYFKLVKKNGKYELAKTTSAKVNTINI